MRESARGPHKWAVQAPGLETKQASTLETIPRDGKQATDAMQEAQARRRSGGNKRYHYPPKMQRQRLDDIPIEPLDMDCDESARSSTTCASQPPTSTPVHQYTMLRPIRKSRCALTPPHAERFAIVVRRPVSAFEELFETLALEVAPDVRGVLVRVGGEVDDLKEGSARRTTGDGDVYLRVSHRSMRS